MKSKFFITLLIILEVFVASIIYIRFNEVAYNGDALYEAQVARNILAGKGYTTQEIPLYAIDLYQQKDLSLQAPWVNTHKFVLPVYLKLIFIKIFGNSLTSVTFLYSYFFHFLTVLLIYFFALKLWPKKHIFAFLSAFIFLINPILGFGTPYIMLSGLNLGIDAFFFLLFLYVMFVWWKERKDWLLFAGGLISGVAFLDRYNSGLYIVITFLVLAYLFVWRREHTISLKESLKIFIKKYLIYISGFAIIAIALLIWNSKVTGHAFLSINGLFQLLFDTKYNSFIDPWYKLEYIFSTDNPVGFALAHPLPLLVKWFKYAALDVVRFVAFENVLWWTPLVLAYFILRRGYTEVSKAIDFILFFVFGLVILQIAILPFWAGSVAYFFYLFPPFSFVIAYVLYSLYLWQRQSQISFTTVRDMANRALNVPAQSLMLNGALITLIGASLLLIVYSSFTLIFKPLSIRGYLVALFTLCVVAGVIIVEYKFKKYLLALFVVLGLTYFISQTGILTAPTQAEILRGRWDLEDNPNTIKTLESLNKGGVSLSITPWNTVWWSDNKLAALPLPEYPDQIYLLEQKYGQQIDSLYLNKISLYPFKYIPYAWSAYARAIQYGYGFDNFDVVKKTQSGIILGKSQKQNQVTTASIDFGKQSANSHLIWGWGDNKLEGSIDYVSAGSYTYLGQTKSIFQGTREDEKKVPKEQIVTVPDIIVAATPSTAKWYAKPQAEITFLAYNQAPRQAQISIRSTQAGTDVTVLLNGNLLYRDQPGINLGTFNLDTNWQIITVSLDQSYLNKGVNKLSFVFTSSPLLGGEETYADFDYVKFD
ncbi:MAG: hypothetical protein Q7T49_00325 [bacterium]|nr:hypothetical protein [bacterium]